MNELDERPPFWPYHPSVGERVMYERGDGTGRVFATIATVAWHDGDVDLAIDGESAPAVDVKLGLGRHTYVPLRPDFQVWWTWATNVCTHRIASFMDRCEQCGRKRELV